jgi:hypothetical protein
MATRPNARPEGLSALNARAAIYARTSNQATSQLFRHNESGLVAAAKVNATYAMIKNNVDIENRSFTI